MRQLEANGKMIAGVRAAQKDPPTVEAKTAVGKPEIAEATAHRLFIERGGFLHPHLGGDAVKERVVQFPETRLGYAQARFNDCVAGRQAALHGNDVQRFAAGRRRDREGQLATKRFGRGVADDGLQPDHAGLHVGTNEEVFDAHGGHREQLDGVHDAAVVVGGAGDKVRRFVAVRGLVQHDAVNRFAGRVQDPHGQQVRGVGFDRVRHVQNEGRFAAFMSAHRPAVHPDLGLVINRPETEQEPAVAAEWGRGHEVAPIPSHAVITRESVLNDPRDFGRHRFRPRGLEPLLIPARVFGIRRQTPFPIQRLDDGGRGLGLGDSGVGWEAGDEAQRCGD